MSGAVLGGGLVGSSGGGASWWHAATTTANNIPFSTRMLRAFREVVGDHHALDLAGALVDLGDLRVAEVPLDRELGDVAVAAEDLDPLAGSAVGDVRRVQLGHRGLAVVGLVA